MKTHISKPFVIALMCSSLLLSGCQAAKKVTTVKKTDSGPTVRLTLAPVSKITPGRDTLVYAKLTHNDGLYALNDNDLEVVHSQKFHLLVVDPSFTDYQHIHPTATSTPGLYSFHFTPKLHGGYRAWADITPIETHTQEFVWTDLGNPAGLSINKTPSTAAQINGYHFTLSFDHVPALGEEATGTITITDSKGNPVTALDTIMGTYSHITGFYDDFRTITHIHPINGDAGSEIRFVIQPQQAGFIKLFAQVKIQGKEMMVPFGLVITKDK